MAENFDENLDNDRVVVEMTDDDGNAYYYTEELVLQVDGEDFAFLLPVNLDDEHVHDENCDCGCGDDSVIIAKIILNEDGEEEYIEPTDEEFEKVSAAYDEFMEENYE